MPWAAFGTLSSVAESDEEEFSTSIDVSRRRLFTCREADAGRFRQFRGGFKTARCNLFPRGRGPGEVALDSSFAFRLFLSVVIGCMFMKTAAILVSVVLASSLARKSLWSFKGKFGYDGIFSPLFSSPRH